MSPSFPPDASLEALSADRLRALVRVSHELNATVDIAALLPQMIELVKATVEAEAGSLWLLDGEDLRCVTSHGPGADTVVGVELPIGAGFVGSAALSKRALLIADVTQDARFLSQVDALTGFKTRSVMAVPLLFRGECLGVMQLMNHVGERGEFNDDDLAFSVALADDCAAALRKAKLLDAERRAHDLEALIEVGREITSTFEIERVLVSLVNLAGRAVPFERCAIAVWEQGSLRVKAVSGEKTIDPKSVAIRRLESLLLWTAERRETLDLPDVQGSDPAAEQLRKSFSELLESSGVKGLLTIPLGDADGDLGVLHFEFARTGFLEKWNREAATLLASQAALAIRNAQLYANVPFISWLEPLAEKRRELAALPGVTLLRYAGLAAVVGLALVLVRLPLRIPAEEAVVRSAVQRPARAGVGGILESVLAFEGDRVTIGQPIARLRNEELAERVRTLEGEREVADRQQIAAEASGDGVAGALARVRVAQLDDALGLLREEAEGLVIAAPTAGVVLTPRLEERVGSWENAGEPVAWVGDPAQAEVELSVLQRDIGEIERDDAVHVRVSAHPYRRLRGRVTSIAPAAHEGPDGPLYTVRAVLDNKEGLLVPGMTAEARVYAGWRPVLSLAWRRPWRWARMHLWW